MVFPNIRNLREDHDYRQRQLAEVLHVSQNTYSQYETGVIELTAENYCCWQTFIMSAQIICWAAQKMRRHLTIK